MSTTSLEERMTAVETELKSLRDEVRSLSARKPNPNWFREVAGSMAAFPEFEEVRREMKKSREAELAKIEKAAE